MFIGNFSLHMATRRRMERLFGCCWCRKIMKMGNIVKLERNIEQSEAKDALMCMTEMFCSIRAQF